MADFEGRLVRRLKKALAVAGVGVAGALLTAAPAFAGSITAPSGNPTSWPGDGSGNPQYQDVSFSGMPANSNVFIEQCDGVDPTTPGWDTADHCDVGTSPAAVIADGSGAGTFQASDANRHFKPFKGVGPSDTFACKAPGEADPPNPDGVPVYTNCRIRVATNPVSNTSDQAFLVMTLPTGQEPPPDTPEVPFAALLPIGALGVGGSYFVIRKRRTARAAA
jgi:hypothetical protein